MAGEFLFQGLQNIGQSITEARRAKERQALQKEQLKIARERLELDRQFKEDQMLTAALNRRAVQEGLDANAKRLGAIAEIGKRHRENIGKVEGATSETYKRVLDSQIAEVENAANIAGRQFNMMAGADLFTQQPQVVDAPKGVDIAGLRADLEAAKEEAKNIRNANDPRRKKVKNLEEELKGIADDIALERNPVQKEGSGRRAIDVNRRARAEDSKSIFNQMMSGDLDSVSPTLMTASPEAMGPLAGDINLFEMMSSVPNMSEVLPQSEAREMVNRESFPGSGILAPGRVPTRNEVVVDQPATEGTPITSAADYRDRLISSVPGAEYLRPEDFNLISEMTGTSTPEQALATRNLLSQMNKREQDIAIAAERLGMDRLEFKQKYEKAEKKKADEVRKGLDNLEIELGKMQSLEDNARRILQIEEDGWLSSFGKLAQNANKIMFWTTDMDIVDTLTKQFQSDVALSAIVNLKQQGGTLGAVSEAELDLLKNSQFSLDPGLGFEDYKRNLMKYLNTRRESLRRIVAAAQEEGYPLSQDFIDAANAPGVFGAEGDAAGMFTPQEASSIALGGNIVNTPSGPYKITTN